MVPYPSSLTYATGPSHAAGPGSGQKVLEPVICFLSQGHAVFVVGTTNRMPVWGASGIKGAFWVLGVRLYQPSYVGSSQHTPAG